MRSEIKELHQRLGTTIVYVTHDQTEALTMADRIVVMHGGLVEQIGRPLELYDRPENLFVAGFIGSPAMNLIEGTMEAAGAFVSASGVRFAVPGLAASDRKVVLGIRPEHLELVAADAPGATTGQVVVIEPTGAETLISLRFGTDTVAALVHSRLDPASGSDLSVRIPEGLAHLFDQETGKRIN